MNYGGKMNRIRFLIILGLLNIGFGFTGCSGKSTDDPEEEQQIVVNYKSINDKFPNPERGFYKYSDNLGANSGMLSESTLKAYRNNNITLLFRYFYLKDFRNAPLSNKVLDDFDRDMGTIRKCGMKCVVRFAYSSAANEPDAPLATILQHLDQLKPRLEKNVDVIAAMQAGFIGAWGEWYYTTNGLYNAGARYQVLNKILEVLPKSRMVQVRTPNYKQEFLQRITPLTQDEAYTEQNIARIGHHNDCFLASVTDYGTYLNVEVDKAYLNKDCLYVPIGGETCPPDGVSPADGLKAYNEMRYLRFSYLNEDYYREVNNQWSSGGYMDNIIREMGYRLELISGEYSETVSRGSAFSARIILKNTGFASLFNERGAELILKNAQNAYRVKLEVDPRSWKPLAESALDLNAGIPADMAPGEYTLYLNLPDAAPSLHDNPNYSVRFANENVWETQSGYNNLLVTIQVKDDVSKTPYTGNSFFKPF